MKNVKEFSKKLIIVLVVYSILMTVWAFILYSIGRDIPEAVVIAFVGGLLGEVSGYLLKAYFGKRREEENKLKLMEMGDQDELGIDN